MEFKIYDLANKVVTIRISEKEFNEISKIKMQLNAGKWHHKITTSELIRRMIIYCLNNNIKHL